MRFWKRLTCPYDNPNDPREFVFVSNTNDRLGVTWNRAHPSAKRKWRRLVAVLLAILVPSFVLYACDKHLWWLYWVAFCLCFAGRGIYLRKLARADLNEFPGLPGPRDGLDEAPTANEMVLMALRVIGILVGILVLTACIVATAKAGLPNWKALKSLAALISFVGSVSCLFAGAVGFYMRASRKLCATLVGIGSLWCMLSLAVMCPGLWRRSASPSPDRILKSPTEQQGREGMKGEG